MKITSAEFIKSATDPYHYPDDLLPEVAFVGRSNVGKSSLINTLVNRKRLAKTSNTPGRTQLVNFFVINEALSFVDLPGYGYAKVPVSVKRGWSAMVEGYLEGRENLRLVVMILDIRREPSGNDDMLAQWLRDNNIEIAFVLTKTDKISRSQGNIARRKIGEHLGVPHDELLPFSAKTRSGKDEIWGVIETACFPGP
ncbi:MAG: YihA family ribosome biogenesis GTP-binding protein [Syntrophobacterales bacterium]|nr:MAG: YihA family ribosome biogenesis GTP-binding protein [Syntrophobacterales bacterium]